MLSRFEKFIYDITEIDLYWHRVATDVMKAYGLKGNYAIYFTKLYACPEGLTAGEISRVCGKDKADVSRDMNALDRLGLIEREQGEGKVYKMRIRLTEQGCAITKEIIEKAEAAVNCVGGELDDEEREIFYKVLDEICENLKALSEKGLPEK